MQEQEQQATYRMMRDALNERQWRLYVALEAKALGRGGIALVARESGTSRTTIQKGLAEIACGELYCIRK
jgi:DNA-binding phage protein